MNSYLRISALAIIAALLSFILFSCSKSNDLTGSSEIIESSENTAASESAAGTTETEIIKKTMKEAFSLLKQMSKTDDLVIYSYDAFSVDSEVKSMDYTIVGYSESKNKNYYIRASETEIELKDINDPDIEDCTFYGIDKFRDSPEMVQDVIDKVNKWDDENGRILINMAQTAAQVGALVTGIGTNEVPYLN